ncbi:MAG: COX15/CtaA family protein [Planctomycetes bacterium]|nr:COX15/CtaA family protein [Planctomycetota bacterium]
MSEQSFSTDSEQPPGRGLHRLAVLAVCLVWPLIWVGGLVTTYDAGMAVPDWPATYGYNLFLYPYKTWLLGPFDLFIEHGHRLLGAVVGLVAIGIVLVAYFRDPRRWVFALALGLLAAVIFQGVLGGMRVVLGDRTLAMVHGCVGPAFFALCVVVAGVTSRMWWQPPTAKDAEARAIGYPLLCLGASLVAISYLQLVLGAQIRHVQPTTPPGRFTTTVAQHVMIAVLLWGLSAIAAWRLRRCGDMTLSRPGMVLVGLVGLQILLGVGTWVVNYGWPAFLGTVPGSTGYLIQAKGFVDSIVVTAHVATGSLILAVSTLVFLRILRVRDRRQHAREMHWDVDASEAVSSAALGQ